jgi:hypothetical protein
MSTSVSSRTLLSITWRFKVPDVSKAAMAATFVDMVLEMWFYFSLYTPICNHGTGNATIRRTISIPIIPTPYPHCDVKETVDITQLLHQDTKQPPQMPRVPEFQSHDASAPAARGRSGPGRPGALTKPVTVKCNLNRAHVSAIHESLGLGPSEDSTSGSRRRRRNDVGACRE